MSRFALLFLLITSSIAAQPEAHKPPTILIVHGAWGGAWQFTRIEPYLREQGYDVRRVTLTGLGERSHLAHPMIGLETHIEDVLNIIRFENLHDVILLGHSYGGMIITGVADRMPERIAKLIYLDAILPENGESVLEAQGSSRQIIGRAENGFVPTWWIKQDKPFPKDMPHPLRSLTEPIVLKNSSHSIPGIYILTSEDPTQPAKDDFHAASMRATRRGWLVITIMGDHNAHWSQPESTALTIGQVLDTR